MIIATERLILRPWQVADLYAMAAWPRFTDPLDADWNWPHELYEQGMIDLFFAMRDADPRRRHWTILQKEGDILGYLDLRDIDENSGSARLGIQLGKPYIGRGYGFEALRAFIDACFGQLQLRCIRLDVGMPNLRARRLYQRLNFREMDTFWRDIGSATEWVALKESRYAHLQHMLRWSTTRLYMQHIEMELRVKDE
jgi:ribosomal-protein-alanine N-acetyltransferase